MYSKLWYLLFRVLLSQISKLAVEKKNILIWNFIIADTQLPSKYLNLYTEDSGQDHET